MNNKKIFCENCTHIFAWNKLINATNYELAPVYVCPKCKGYRFKIIEDIGVFKDKSNS